MIRKSVSLTLIFALSCHGVSLAAGPNYTCEVYGGLPLAVAWDKYPDANKGYLRPRAAEEASRVYPNRTSAARFTAGRPSSVVKAAAGEPDDAGVAQKEQFILTAKIAYDRDKIFLALAMLRESMEKAGFHQPFVSFGPDKGIVRITEDLMADHCDEVTFGGMNIKIFAVRNHTAPEGVISIPIDEYFLSICLGNKVIGHGMVFPGEEPGQVMFRYSIHGGPRAKRAGGEDYRGAGHGRNALRAIMAICAQCSLFKKPVGRLTYMYADDLKHTDTQEEFLMVEQLLRSEGFDGPAEDLSCLVMPQEENRDSYQLYQGIDGANGEATAIRAAPESDLSLEGGMVERIPVPKEALGPYRPPAEEDRAVEDRELRTEYERFLKIFRVDEGMTGRIAQEVNLGFVPDTNPATNEPYSPYDFYGVADEEPATLPFDFVKSSSQALVRYVWSMAGLVELFDRNGVAVLVITNIMQNFFKLPSQLQLTIESWSRQLVGIFLKPFERLYFARRGAIMVMEGPTSSDMALPGIPVRYNCIEEVYMRLWGEFAQFETVSKFRDYAIEELQCALIGAEDPASPGDIIIYFDDDSSRNPAHAGIVTKVNRKGRPVQVWSKFGTSGVFVHQADISPQYARSFEILRPPTGTAPVMVTKAELINSPGEMLSGGGLKTLRVKRLALHFCSRTIGMMTGTMTRILMLYRLNKEIRSLTARMRRGETLEHETRLALIVMIRSLLEHITAGLHSIDNHVYFESLDMGIPTDEVEEALGVARMFTSSISREITEAAGSLHSLILNCGPADEIEAQLRRLSFAYNHALLLNHLIPRSDGSGIDLSRSFNLRYTIFDRLKALNAEISRLEACAVQRDRWIDEANQGSEEALQKLIANIGQATPPQDRPGEIEHISSHLTDSAVREAFLATVHPAAARIIEVHWQRYERGEFREAGGAQPGTALETRSLLSSILRPLAAGESGRVSQDRTSAETSSLTPHTNAALLSGETEIHLAWLKKVEALLNDIDNKAASSPKALGKYVNASKMARWVLRNIALDDIIDIRNKSDLTGLLKPMKRVADSVGIRVPAGYDCMDHIIKIFIDPDSVRRTVFADKDERENAEALKFKRIIAAARQAAQTKKFKYKREYSEDDIKFVSLRVDKLREQVERYVAAVKHGRVTLDILRKRHLKLIGEINLAREELSEMDEAGVHGLSMQLTILDTLAISLGEAYRDNVLGRRAENKDKAEPRSALSWFAIVSGLLAGFAPWMMARVMAYTAGVDIDFGSPWTALITTGLSYGVSLYWHEFAHLLTRDPFRDDLLVIDREGIHIPGSKGWAGIAMSASLSALALSLLFIFPSHAVMFASYFAINAVFASSRHDWQDVRMRMSLWLAKRRTSEKFIYECKLSLPDSPLYEDFWRAIGPRANLAAPLHSAISSIADKLMDADREERRRACRILSALASEDDPRVIEAIAGQTRALLHVLRREDKRFHVETMEFFKDILLLGNGILTHAIAEEFKEDPDFIELICLNMTIGDDTSVHLNAANMLAAMAASRNKDILRLLGTYQINTPSGKRAAAGFVLDDLTPLEMSILEGEDEWLGDEKEAYNALLRGRALYAVSAFIKSGDARLRRQLISGNVAPLVLRNLAYGRGNADIFNHLCALKAITALADTKDREALRQLSAFSISDNGSMLTAVDLIVNDMFSGNSDIREAAQNALSAIIKTGHRRLIELIAVKIPDIADRVESDGARKRGYAINAMTALARAKNRRITGEIAARIGILTKCLGDRESDMLRAAHAFMEFANIDDPLMREAVRGEIPRVQELAKSDDMLVQFNAKSVLSEIGWLGMRPSAITVLLSKIPVIGRPYARMLVGFHELLHAIADEEPGDINIVEVKGMGVIGGAYSAISGYYDKRYFNHPVRVALAAPIGLIAVPLAVTALIFVVMTAFAVILPPGVDVSTALKSAVIMSTAFNITMAPFYLAGLAALNPFNRHSDLRNALAALRGARIRRVYSSGGEDTAGPGARFATEENRDSDPFDKMEGGMADVAQAIRPVAPVTTPKTEPSPILTIPPPTLVFQVEDDYRGHVPQQIRGTTAAEDVSQRAQAASCRNSRSLLSSILRPLAAGEEGRVYPNRTSVADGKSDNLILLVERRFTGNALMEDISSSYYFSFYSQGRVNTRGIRRALNIMLLPDEAALAIRTRRSLRRRDSEI